MPSNPFKLRFNKFCTGFGKTSKDIHIAQGCKTHGFIVRNKFNLYICDDPECTSCREWDNAMKQELKKLNLVK